MVTSRVQTLRSSTALQRPAVGARQPGELWANFPDLAFGVIDNTQTPRDLLVIRAFSPLTSYVLGHYVVNSGQLYRAKGAIPPGTFNSTQWDAILPLSGLLQVDGAGSGLDADLLDGQDGAYYLNLANSTGVLPSDAAHGARGGGTLHTAATGSVPGFMSAADKSKLDGVMNGATDDMTGSELLAALAPVDGPSSGLNADLLDDQHGAFYQDASNMNAGTLPAGRINDTSHGNRGGGTLHALATPAVAGFFVDAANDGKQYVRRNTTWQEVVVPPNTAVGDTPPVSPAAGQLWWESDTGALYIYYQDADGSQWVQIVPGAGGSGAYTPDRILSQPADMWAGFRTGSSFVVNDAWDGSGTDLLTVPDVGPVVIGRAGTPGGMRSMGLIEGINTGFSFNLYNDGTNWRRRLASGVGLIDCTAAGIVEIYGAGTGAADSVAAIGIAARFQYAGTNNFYGGNQFNGPITVVNSSCSVDARGTSTHGIVTTAGTNAGGLLAYANAQTIYGGCGYFAASSGTWCFYGAASSGFLQGGTWQVSSDARMKENFELIDPQASLEAVKALPAWSFTWKHARMTQPDKEPQRIGGWKAQEMKSLVPIAITERSVDKIDVATRTVLKKLSKIPKGKSLEALQDEPMKALGMDLQTVVATLWAAVQALSAKVEELEAAR